jgi:Protein of unknown function (DUF3306)
MSDPENFLSRWSRRKLEVPQETDQVNLPAADERGEDRPSGKASPRSAPISVESAFDPASLPPIESITAETDISGFLAAGVPSELTRAALRRAWASDPKIRNFVGLADYDWDFNAAGSMAGFGPLEMIDEVGKVVGRMVEPDRTGADASNLLDPVSATPETRRTAPETGSDGDPAAAIEGDNQATQGGDGRMIETGTSPHRDERMGGGYESIAVQDKAEKPDRSRSFVKRQHGGALPK